MPLSSTTLAKIIDGSAIASFVINQDHKVTHWNTAMEALSGIKREQMIGKDSCSEVFYSHKRPTMADLISQPGIGSGNREILPGEIPEISVNRGGL